MKLIPNFICVEDNAVGKLVVSFRRLARKWFSDLIGLPNFICVEDNAVGKLVVSFES